MLIRRRDSWPEDLARIRDDFSQLFDLPLRFLGLDREEEAHPKVEVFERRDEIVLRAELPGVKSEDLEVRVLDAEVTLKGEVKLAEEKHEGYYRSERRYGAFLRTITLPSEVLAGESKATFQDGVLELVIPKKKAEENKGHRVEIKSSNQSY